MVNILMCLIVNVQGLLRHLISTHGGFKVLENNPSSEMLFNLPRRLLKVNIEIEKKKNHISKASIWWAMWTQAIVNMSRNNQQNINPEHKKVSTTISEAVITSTVPYKYDLETQLLSLLLLHDSEACLTEQLFRKN